jgi:hypothetical protein
MNEILLSALVLAVGLLGRILPIMIIGVIAAELIVALGYVNKISFLARPITNFSHLRHECGVSLLVAFGSAMAANAMLAKYYEEGLISKREMFIASLLNTFPGGLQQWRSSLPAVISLLGVTGLFYFFIIILVGLTKTALLMVAGRLLLPKRPKQQLSLEMEPRPPLKDAFIRSLKSSRRTIKRMLTITVPTILIMSILIQLGVFNSLAAYLSGVSAYLPVPASGLSIIASMFGNAIAAFSVASNLLATGEITAKGVILSLLIGTIFSATLYAFRASLPRHISIFGPKTGVQIILLSSAIRSVIVIIFVVIMAMFW